MVIFNPPSLVGLLWRMAKLVLNENTFKKLAVASGIRELDEHFERGTLPLKDAPDPSLRLSIFSLPPPRALGEKATWPSVWSGVPAPPLSLLYVKPRSSVSVPIAASSGARVLWRFLANSELAYSLHGPDGRLLAPTFSVATFQLPEEGAVCVEEGGEVALTFTNSTSLLFAAQVHCALLALPPP